MEQRRRVADLSKAFERVNPHWIIALLCIKGAPTWVIRYSQFILFDRRVTHKVQGRLLHSRVIRRGVDMGRSFSVFLFCFALDPLFHYLNRIPNVISVQAYVDDTTVIGNAQDASWLHHVSQCYAAVRSAGFVVDAHECYRSLSNSQMKFGPSKLGSSQIRQSWPDILNSPAYPTATAAIRATLRPGYNSLVVRFARWPITNPLQGANEDEAPHVALNVSYAQGIDIVHGLNMHKIGCFAAMSCSCKSKSHIVTNVALRPLALAFAERAGYGVHAITPHAPALGLAIFGRLQFDDNGDWSDSHHILSLQDCKLAPFKKIQLRLKSFKAPTLSVMARSTCFNTYILSVMPYTDSYFGVSSRDINLLRQQAVKFVIGRHWIESEMLPYVLRFLGISVMLDPALSVTVAAVGLYFRSGNCYEELWLNDYDQMSSRGRNRWCWICSTCGSHSFLCKISPTH